MSDLKALAVELAQVEALLGPPYSVRVSNAIAALTAAAEREAGLRGENDAMREREGEMFVQAHDYLFRAQAAEADEARLTAELERLDLEANRHVAALAAERQKVQALIEARRWHKSAQGVNEEEAGMASRRLIELLDALGLPSPDAPQPTQETNCAECDGSGLVPSTWVDDEQPNRTCPVCDGSGTTDADSVPQPPGTARETP